MTTKAKFREWLDASGPVYSSSTLAFFWSLVFQIDLKTKMELPS